MIYKYIICDVYFERYNDGGLENGNLSFKYDYFKTSHHILLFYDVL